MRLDSVLPYLNLAISTVALLNQSEAGWGFLDGRMRCRQRGVLGTCLGCWHTLPLTGSNCTLTLTLPYDHITTPDAGAAAPLSASRLMSASWHLRSNPQPGAAVFSLPEASWHVERQLTAAGPSMGEVCRLCSLTVGRAAAPPADSAAGTGANGPGGGSSGDGSGGGTPFCYELLVQQDLADGVHHEADENPQTIRLQVRRWHACGCCGATGEKGCSLEKSWLAGGRCRLRCLLPFPCCMPQGSAWRPASYLSACLCSTPAACCPPFARATCQRDVPLPTRSPSPSPPINPAIDRWPTLLRWSGRRRRACSRAKTSTAQPWCCTS